MKASLLRRAVTTFAILGLAFVAGRAVAQQTRMDQPHMQNALNALRNAHTELDQAARDKGGYRTRAQNHVTDAINEVESGISFANEH